MDRWSASDYREGPRRNEDARRELPEGGLRRLERSRRSRSRPVTVAYVATQSSKDTRRSRAAIGAAYVKVGAFMKANGLKQAGAVQTINNRWDDTGLRLRRRHPRRSRADQGGPRRFTGHRSSRPTRARRSRSCCKGPYSQMPADLRRSSTPSWRLAATRPTGRPGTSTSPIRGTTPEAELITNVYQPVK